jgi:predicted membrane protein
MKEKKPIMFFLALLFFVMLTIQSLIECIRSIDSSFYLFIDLMGKNFISLGFSFLIGIPIASVIAYQHNK